MNHIPKDPFQVKIEIRNWLLLGVASAISFLLLPINFTLGLVCGGLISIANFYGLYLSLKKAFSEASGRAKAFIMVRYYMRFFLTAIVLYFLLTRTSISVFGLLLGLSLVVINLIASTLLEFSKKNISLRTEEVS